MNGQIEREYREALDSLRFSDGEKERMMKNLMERQERAPVKRRGMRALRTALIAAALCLALAGTALAASPGLREMLAAAMGGFAPYAQGQGGEPHVINGIEFRVKSVLADDFSIRAYVEAKDLEGGFFHKIDDLTIPTRIWGGVALPLITEWLDPNSSESWSTNAECLGYDEETETALLVVSSWKLMPENFTGAAVELLEMTSYLTGDCEVVWRNEEGVTIPVDVKPVESTVLGADTALASGLDAVEARLSPLGLTIIFEDYNIVRSAIENTRVSVKLKDGSVVEAPWGGLCGVFPPPFGESSYRVMTWNFREPVEADQIKGVYVGEGYFPLP